MRELISLTPSQARQTCEQREHTHATACSHRHAHDIIWETLEQVSPFARHLRRRVLFVHSRGCLVNIWSRCAGTVTNCLTASTGTSTSTGLATTRRGFQHAQTRFLGISCHHQRCGQPVQDGSLPTQQATPQPHSQRRHRRATCSERASYLGLAGLRPEATVEVAKELCERKRQGLTRRSLLRGA